MGWPYPCVQKLWMIVSNIQICIGQLTELLPKMAVELAFSKFFKKGLESSLLKPPIFILHGIFGSKMNWKSIGKNLSLETNRLVSLKDHHYSHYSVSRVQCIWLPEWPVIISCIHHWLLALLGQTGAVLYLWTYHIITVSLMVVVSVICTVVNTIIN